MCHHVTDELTERDGVAEREPESVDDEAEHGEATVAPADD